MIDSLINKYLPRGSFIRNVLTLATGATAAQTIPIISSPILRRLYTPSEFGVLAIYSSCIALMSVIVNGRYQVAITLPAHKEDAANVASLCLFLSLVISSFSLFLVSAFNPQISQAIGNYNISAWLYFIPPHIFLVGIYNTFLYWCIRKGKYGKITQVRIASIIVTTGLNLLAGFLKIGISGLIFSGLIGELIASLILSHQIYIDDKELFKSVSFSSIKKQLIRYQKFPLYSLPADLINSFSSEIPNLLFGKFFGINTLGRISLTKRIILAPSSVISNSILDIFKKEASSEYRNNGRCIKSYSKTFKILSLLSIVPFIIIIVSAPEIFAFAFGQQWKEAGEYAQVMSPILLLGFIASPLSYTFYIAEKQLEDLILHIYIAISSISSILLGNYFFEDPKYILLIYSLNYAFIYSIYLFRSFVLAQGKENS